MTRILVTGAAGFIGFHVAQALLERGDEVIGIDNLNDYYDPKLKEARLALLKNHTAFTFHKVDVADKDALFTIFTESAPEKVCHLAAQAGVRYSLKNPFAYEETNGKGMLVILEACRHHGVTSLVYASSSSVYGGNEKLPFSEEDRVDTPISVYAATKKFNEELAHVYHRLFGLHCVGLRFFTVYGPWGRPDMALFLFTKKIIADEPIPLFNKGKHKRDFTYIDDVTQGVLAAIDKELEYEVINLARGESVELLAYVKALEEALGKKAEKDLLPMQPGDVEATAADISKASELLGYDPRTSITEGVRRFVEWYKEYYGGGQ